MKKNPTKTNKKQFDLLAGTRDCAVCLKLKSNMQEKKYCFECFSSMLKECKSCKLPFFKKCSFFLCKEKCNLCYQKWNRRQMISKQKKKCKKVKNLTQKTCKPNMPLEGIAHCS